MLGRRFSYSLNLTMPINCCSRWSLHTGKKFMPKNFITCIASLKNEVGKVVIFFKITSTQYC